MTRHGSILLAACLLVPLAAGQTLEESAEVEDLDVMRYENGTPDNGRDDVFVLDVDDDDAISVGDFILATSGAAGTVAGRVITNEHSAIFDRGADLVRAEVVYADYPNENGDYGAGDWVFISGDDNELFSTKGNEDEYSIRLTDTDSGEAGSILITGHDDLTTFRNDVDDDLGFGSGRASFTWVDSNGNGRLDDGEDAYITPGHVDEGDPIPTGAILLDYAPEPPANVPPVPELVASATSGEAPLEVVFTLNATDEDGDALSWTFDADDDGEDDASGDEGDLPAEVTFAYAVGNYSAVFSVDDGSDAEVATAVIQAMAPAADDDDGATGDGQDGDDSEEEEEPSIPGFSIPLLAAGLGLAMVLRRR